MGRSGLFCSVTFSVLLMMGNLACNPDTDLNLGVHHFPIINGSPDYEHDSVVAILFGDYLCSGTLITHDVVLTAGHCAYGYQPSDFTVLFGTDANAGIARGVSEVRVHPQYDSYNIVNDLALLRLSSAPPAGVDPIPFLPHSLGIDSSDVNKNLEYVGFGQTETGSVGVRLTIDHALDWVCTSPAGCTVGPGYGASPNTICSSQSTGGTCHGDSGGPAFVLRSGKEYVAGVTSYGDQNCLYFGCSTKVDEFESFIVDFVGGTNGSVCSDPEDCLSGYCADGVCCESDCSELCMTCNLAGSEGVCMPAPDGSSCSDGNLCNGQETCSAQTCQAGQALNCDDSNVCTMDGCEPDMGCVHEPVLDGTACPDGNLCNGQETCSAGVCVSGQALTCDDGNDCTSDSCDPVSACINSPVADGTPCGGGQCGSASCHSGACMPDDESVCDDADPCTEDSCSVQAGCMHDVVPNGTVCGGCRTCFNGLCIPDDDCELTGDGCSCGGPLHGSHHAGLWVLLFFLLAVSRLGRIRIHP